MAIDHAKQKQMDPEHIKIRIAGAADEQYAAAISIETALSAKARGSGISQRSPEMIISKMREGKAVIAVCDDGNWVGFSYIEVWANGEFVSNSGLIVSPRFRQNGIAAAIKKKIFRLSRRKYPAAKIFSITTGLAIMKMNARLGFQPVTYSELPAEKKFWQGCRSCVNYNILRGKNCSNCLCTAMLFNPADHKTPKIMEAIA